MPEPIDLRWVTAICQVLTGMVAVATVIVVWWLEPHERAKRLGPYVTPEGMRRILTNLPNGLMFGLFLLLSGTSKWAFYERWHGDISSEIALAIGIFEAAMGILFVAILIWKTIRAA